MSSKTLPQNGIDSLFGDEQAAGSAPDRKGEVQVYDFRRPHLISKDHMRALQAMYGILVKSMESWVNTRTRGDVELHLASVDQVTFGEFTISLANPCSSFVFDIADSPQQAVIDFGREFAFFLVDRFLGASGVAHVPERTLTPLERMIVRIVADRLTDQLRETWQDHVRLALELNRFESIPDMLTAVNREDPVLVANVLARTAGMESKLYVCLPFALLEKFFTGTGVRHTRVAGASSRERTVEVAQIQRNLRSTGITVTAHLPEFPIRLSALRALAPGYVLRTNLPADARITLLVEGQPRFYGTVGRASRSLAVRIDEVQCGDLPQGGTIIPAQRNPNITQSNETMAELGETVLSDLQAAGTVLPAAALSSLMTVTLPVSIELGRTRMTLQEVMELGRGALVQLDRLVGEPVDVVIGDRRFAEGEVVVMGEQFGIRITRIVGAAPDTP